MFSVRLAGMVIGIDHKYDFVRILCRDYLDSAPPLLTVSAKSGEIEEEIEKNAGELNLTGESLAGYAESVCIYRKICETVSSENIFLFHGAALMYDGKAYLFSAPSGTGKTTHLKLWMRLFGKDLTVINGDKPLLRKNTEGEFLVYGTPWCGKEGWQSNCSAPLAAICFLERAERNEISRLSSAEASARAMKQILFPKDPALLLQTLKLTDSLLSTVPLYLLKCNMSEEAARLSFEVMTGCGK